ncbi:hypothetical protein TSAR_005048 [Trichomalopsis sarcophagae]|uniref:Abasic site processing protein HMCES n=1 Tax=Trichomalopsis sarcophagae TaxID=543379 RepID=A0A232F925_9HYME|nr:hypothetical protein TSAR_005048 [Trichomalopsis sarcophagae]
MCRFCACELSKEQLSKQCAYKKDNLDHEVSWSKNSNFVDYHPSTMLQPKNTGLPVIINGKHLQSTDSRIFCPMYWSLIPPWYKGDLNDWNALTHNARVENLKESKIYSASLSEGKRCVVVMEGFFEYKKSGSQPAGVYYLQSLENHLLKAAGLFNTIKRENGETLYSCTVITTESESNVKQVHHRSPLLLHQDADVETWLDFQSVSSADAVSKIKANKQIDLQFHRTSKMGSKEPATAKKVLASKGLMSNWLKTGTNKGVKRKAEN